jgi:hypothetical protein
MTEINDQEFTITDTGATTFTLDGEDATGHTAYSSGGIVTSWIDGDGAGAVSATGSHGGGSYLYLLGTGSEAAKRTQKVTVAAGDQNVEHTLLLSVGGSITPSNSQYITGVQVAIRIGSTSGDDDFYAETMLGTGLHFLKFTPTGGTFYVQFLNSNPNPAFMKTAAIWTSALQLSTPFNAGALQSLRYDQSGDVVYLACDGFPNYKVERRAAGSWSFVLYEPLDGPWRPINTTGITMAITAVNGIQTITASDDFFRPDHQGSLIKLSSVGQTVIAQVTSATDTFTSAIKVTGVTSARAFSIDNDLSTPGVGTTTLQRSLISENGPWTDVLTRNTDTTFSFEDQLDNQTAWYRLGMKAADYTSGTINLELEYAYGSIDGIARISARLPHHDRFTRGEVMLVWP